MSESEGKAPGVFWSLAASYGVVWGAAEVTLGAFLHSMHVPGRGFFLSVCAAIFLVCQRRMLPVRGLSIATALVAALLKGFSPGGALLGPMIAISAEGLAAELAFLISRRPGPLSALLCGFLSVAFSVAQPLVFQGLVFGQDILRIYGVLLGRAAAWLSVEQQDSLAFLLLLFVLISLAGGAFAIWGLRLGRLAAALANRSTAEAAALPPLPVVAEAAPAVVRRRATKPVIWLQRLLALALLLSNVLGLLWAVLPCLAVWFFVLFYASPHLSRRFLRPGLWFWASFFSITAGLLLGPTDTRVLGLGFSSSGLISGLWMALRGFSILGLVAWLADGLTRSNALSAMGRLGMRGAEQAIRAAVEALPGMQDELAAVWRNVRITEGYASMIQVESALVSVLARAYGKAEERAAEVDGGGR